jgi:hypothetical protein
MAIQLNDRDQLIFKMIDEHQVLLEKHISWFISGDDKPVLIRDRLRKLFYLDYLLCQRHSTKLPWWTTPTKPLVYMLAPMSKQLAENNHEEIDLFDANVQRHLLEVANVRMLCLMSQKEAEITNFSWATRKPTLTSGNLDAVVSFNAKDESHKVGIINHPSDKAKLVSNLDQAFKDDSVDLVLVISRDDAHQKQLQDFVTSAKSNFNSKNVLFITHHELYKSGITKACWLNAECEQSTFFANPLAGMLSPSYQNPSVASA